MSDIIGRVMSCVRKDAVMTQGEVGALFGVSQGRVAHFELGHGFPNALQLYRFERKMVLDESDPIPRMGFVLEITEMVAAELRARGVPVLESAVKPKLTLTRRKLDHLVEDKVEAWLEAQAKLKTR